MMTVQPEGSFALSSVFTKNNRVFNQQRFGPLKAVLRVSPLYTYPSCRAQLFKSKYIDFALLRFPAVNTVSLINESEPCC